MAFLSGYKPRAYVLCLLPQEGVLYLSDGVRTIPIEAKREDMPVCIPARPEHWLNHFWKTDVCAGKFGLYTCYANDT